MRVNVVCSSCGKPYNVDDSLLGKSTKCRQCGQTFTLVASENGSPAKATASPAATESGQEAPLKTAVAAPPSVATRPANAPLERLARFEIRARLGAGAFGTVYRAFDPQLEREIALKVPQASVLDSPKRIERFLREAKSAAQLRHPNIVPIYDAGQEDGHHYIASAFIQGHPLSDVIDEKGMNPRRAAQIVAKLAEALAYAHQLGIVHRDIKPANVMIDDDDMPHLMDFGLAARTESTEKLTQDGAILGTPAYMAPEHAAGHSGESFPDSDQYSLGVVLYELLTGKTPWEGPPQIVLYNVLHKEPPKPRSLRKDIPRDLETICLKAMAKEPKHRFLNCQAMADDLRRWLEGEPVKARRPNFGERVVRWVKREPKMAAAGVFSLVGLITLAVGLGLLAQHLQGEVAGEKTAHGSTKKSLTDEQVNHQFTKGDRYTKQVGLAKGQIDGHDLAAALQTLAGSPVDFRGWEWGHLRLLAEGYPDAMQVLNPPPPARGRVLRIDFSADSKQLLAQYGFGRRMVWELANTANPRMTEGKGVGDMPPPQFSADGKFAGQQIFTAINPGEPPPPQKLMILEVATGKELPQLSIPGARIVFALNADGSKVAVAAAENWMGGPFQIKVYDPQSGQETHKVESEFASVTSLVFSPDSASLAVIQGGGTFVTKRLIPETQKEIVEGKTVERTVYKEVQETHQDKGVGLQLIELATGKEHLAVKRDLVGSARAIFTADGKQLFFLHPAGTEVYGLADGKELFTLPGCAGAVAVSPDGKRIATASGGDACPADGLIKLWDAATGQFIVGLRTKGYTHTYDQLLFSPDGAWLAAAPSHSSQIFVFSTGGGRMLTPYYEHGAPVNSVAWSPDGKLLSSWSDCNQTARVWDAADAKTQFVATGERAAGLGFSTTGQHLYTSAGCLGAAPHGFGMHGATSVYNGVHGGYGAHGGHGMHGGFGGGHGCLGGFTFESVNVFSTNGFQAMPAPKGFEKILASSKDGSRWVVKPALPIEKGKPFSADKMPRPQLWNVADQKEVVAYDEMDINSQAQFTDDGRRVLGIGKGMAKTTAYRSEMTKEKRVRTETKVVDGKKVDEKVEYEVDVSKYVPYERTVFASHLKLFETESGKKLFQVAGVDDLFAVSADGKLVATLPPKLPLARPMPMKMPAIQKRIDSKDAPKKIPAPAPKEAPKKVGVARPESSKGVDLDPGASHALRVAQGVPPGVTEDGLQAIAQEKVKPAPPPPQPEWDAPEAFLPPPPTAVSVWVVDQKETDGMTLRRTCQMPGQVTMLRFSPDGKYLAAYAPNITETVTYTVTRNETMMVDGKPMTKAFQENKLTKRQYSLLKVFDTATGKDVVSHVGASGLAIFSPDSSKIASAAGFPLFVCGHAGGFIPPPPPGVSPPPPPKEMPKNGAPKAVRGPDFRSREDFGSLEFTAFKEPPVAAPVAAPDEEFIFGHPAMPMVQTSIHVFDLKSGQEFHAFHGHASPATALAFTPDSKLLASGSYGVGMMCGDPPGKHFAQIRIWDVPAKKPYQSIDGHSGRINCLEFDPQGKRLASASDDTTVKVWRVEATSAGSMQPAVGVLTANAPTQ